MRTPLLLSLVAAAALSLVSVSAHAQSDRDRAATLVEQGTALFAQGEFEESAILFQEAYNLDPHPVLMYNIARSHQEMGDLPAALDFFRDVLAFDADEAVANAARSRIRDIEVELRSQGYDPISVESGDYVPRGSLALVTVPEGAGVSLGDTYLGVSPVQVPAIDAGEYIVHVTMDGYYPITATVEVRGARENVRTFVLENRTSLDTYVPPQPGYLTVLTPEPGMRVALDGQSWGEAPLDALGVTPGRYTVTVQGENYLGWSEEIEIRAGEETRVLAAMTRIAGTEDRTAERRSRLGAGLIGAGGAMIVTGGVMGVLALQSAADYRDDVADPARRAQRDAARTRALVSDVAIGTGLASVGAGLAIRLTAHRFEPVAAPGFEGLVLAPGITRRGFGVTVRAAF